MFAPVSAAVCRRQPKQVGSTLSHISYSVILFSSSEKAPPSAFEYGPGLSRSFQVSAEAEIYKPIIDPGRCATFFFFFPPFCFSKAGVKAHCPTPTVTHHHFTTKDCIAFINLPQLTVIWSKCDLRLLVLIVVTLGMR